MNLRNDFILVIIGFFRNEIQIYDRFMWRFACNLWTDLFYCPSPVDFATFCPLIQRLVFNIVTVIQEIVEYV